VDYCNAVLAGAPRYITDKLQRVLNAAARRVTERVQLKLGLTIRRCLRRRAPRYLVDYCTSVADVVSRQHLRSVSRRQLVVPRHCLSTFGRRAFAVAGPMSWNSLPNSLRKSACDDNILDDCFKHLLKTFLFSGY